MIALDRLDNATYGLSALNTDLDTILARIGVPATSLKADHDDIDTYLATMREKTTPAFDRDTDSLEAIREAIDALNDIAASDVWDYLIPATPVAGSYGERVKDYLDVAVSSRSSHSAADVWTVATRLLTGFTGTPRSDLVGADEAIYTRLDVAVSTRASATNLSAHDSDIKADLGDFSARTNLNSLLAILGWADVVGVQTLEQRLGFQTSGSVESDLTTIKGYTDEVESLLKNATYGLSALNTDLDTLITRLGDPSPSTIKALIDSIESKLDNGTYGLSALQTLLTDIEGTGFVKDTHSLVNIEAYVDEVESLLKNATYGLSALKTEIDANETKIDTVDTVVDAIKAKTDNLPTDPADQSQVEAHVTSEVDDLITRTKGLDDIHDDVGTALSRLGSDGDTYPISTETKYISSVATPVSPAAGSIAAELDTLVAATSP